MKDAAGNTLSVGDHIAYAMSGYTTIYIGTIAHFTPRGMKVAEDTPTGPRQWTHFKQPGQVALIRRAHQQEIDHD